MAQRVRKRSGETSTETLWRDVCGGAMTKGPMRCHGATSV